MAYLSGGDLLSSSFCGRWTSPVLMATVSELVPPQLQLRPALGFTHSDPGVVEVLGISGLYPDGSNQSCVNDLPAVGLSCLTGSILFELHSHCFCRFSFPLVRLFLCFIFELAGRLLMNLSVCLSSILDNWGVGSVGAAHLWRLALPYTPNLHSCVDVRSSGSDLDWDSLYELPHSVHTRGLLLASRPAIATARQQTCLSAQGWATFLAGPLWGCRDCLQCCGSLGNWPWGQVGAPSQWYYAVLQSTASSPAG